MKTKRKTKKNQATNVKIVNLEGIEVHDEDDKTATYVNEIPLNQDQSSHIVNTLCTIEHRLEASENVWKLFFHKLLEIRSNLESKEQNSSSTIKYEIKYEPQLSESYSDSENSVLEESDVSDLPISTVTDFKHLNRTCYTNSELEQKIQNYFLKLSSEHLTLRKWCETNLSLLLTDSVANEFSWNGSKLTSTIKEPVYNTKTIKILINCAKIKYDSCVKSDIEQCIRWWFARTTLRMAINNSPVVKH